MWEHKYTYYTQTYVIMDELMYVFVYMLYGCLHLAMHISRQT